MVAQNQTGRRCICQTAFMQQLGYMAFITAANPGKLQHLSRIIAKHPAFFFAVYVFKPRIRLKKTNEGITNDSAEPPNAFNGFHFYLRELCSAIGQE